MNWQIFKLWMDLMVVALIPLWPLLIVIVLAIAGFIIGYLEGFAKGCFDRPSSPHERIYSIEEISNANGLIENVKTVPSEWNQFPTED